MKSYILLLIVGVVSVLANPIDKPENISNEELPSTETSVLQPEVKLEDATLTVYDDPKPNKVEIIQDFLPKSDLSGDSTKFGEGEVDIVIEETVTPLEETMSDAQNEIKIDEDDYLAPGNQLIDNILADRIKDEIMETAAGFAPVPLLFRKRNQQPPRRRFAIRRQFQRYPYAPYRRFPIYYPYYRFYRPSSLRFY